MNLSDKKTLLLIAFVILLTVAITFASLLLDTGKKSLNVPDQATPQYTNSRKATKNQGDLHILNLQISTSGRSLTGVKLTFNYNPAKLHFVDFKPSNALDSTFFNYNIKFPNLVQIIGIDTKNKAINNSVNLGSLLMQGDVKELMNITLVESQFSSQNALITNTNNTIKVSLISKELNQAFPLVLQQAKQ